MLYDLLANLVLLVHLLFILFVIFGGLLVIRRHWLAWIHLPCVSWGVLLEFLHWTCPLTPLEKYLRRLADGLSYDGGFIEHYLGIFIYPGWLTPQVQIAMGVALTVLNLVIYGYILAGIVSTDRRKN